jgi:hypothetical protein
MIIAMLGLILIALMFGGDAVVDLVVGLFRIALFGLAVTAFVAVALLIFG